MKKIFIYLLAFVLLYGFFRELNIVKTLMICFGLGAAYLVYLVPVRNIISMKYPFICFTFVVTALFLIYPKIDLRYPIDTIVIFVSFYGLTFYIITIEEKAKDLSKEAAGLSVLFLSIAFNLSMIGKPVFILPISVAAIFFLFIIGKNLLIPFLTVYTLAIMILLFSKKIIIFGGGIKINDLERYMLLAASFTFLATCFIWFVKKNNFIVLMAFFGFLYIATDIFMVLSFRLSTGLIYQPLAALLVLTPLVGIMLKPEREYL